jgi:hypothetical protein
VGYDRLTDHKCTEGIIAEDERLTEDPCCKKCFVFETRLKETLEELSSTQLIIQLLRNEVNVGMDLTRKQNGGGIVNMKNTMGEPSEKINMKEKWSDVVAGRSIDRRNEDSTSNHLLESNMTSHITEESWKTVSRGRKNLSSVNHALYYQIPVIINRYALPRNRGSYAELAWD